MSENVFQSMPEIPAEEIEAVKKSFTNYLFFKKVKDGVREYTCSSCGEKFKRGRNVHLRTFTENDVNLSSARIGEFCTCPCCGKVLEVKNANHCAFSSLYEMKNYLFYVCANENEVWFRGFMFEREFSNDLLVPPVTKKEVCRYQLTPGNARFWKKYWYCNAFCEEKTITEPFLWHQGFYCEKYIYCFESIADTELNNTFLKYCSYDLFCDLCGYKAPAMKYLSWYSIHPQIELLVKTGNHQIIEYIVSQNTDFPRYLNWNARTPWELFRLSREEYSIWIANGRDFDLLRVYKRLGDTGVKAFEKAKVVYKFFQSYYATRKLIIHVNSMAKKEGKTAYDAVKYFEKISRESAGACHHCPGITSKEAYDLWEDYIEMLKAVNPKLKNVPLFPHDLKERHDELLKAKQRKAAKDRAKADKKYIAELIEKYKKFNKVDEVCESIAEKYSFTDGEFSIIVPKGMKEILKESVALNMCIHRVDNGRYFDRIERRETYILFLRKNKNLKKPWYIIEVEPNGTVQQKRTTDDSQYDDDISAFTPFLREWQKFVSSKLTKSDIELARESKRLREENFADLRKTKKQVNYGNHRGELLIDLLEKDLLEVIAG